MTTTTSPPPNRDHTARLSFSAGTLTLERASRALADSLLPPDTWVWDARASLWRCDALQYAKLRGRLAQQKWPLVDEVPLWKRVSWLKSELHTLRADQAAAVTGWMTSKQGVIVMPTGTGKTEVALTIMQQTAVSTLVVAPVRDLMYQWHRRILQGLGFDAGVIGDNTYRVRPISVTTYDSACIHMERLGQMFGLLIFDECHHLPGAMRRDAARMSAAPFRLGLTATPERTDGKHSDLDWLIGPLAHETKLSDARGKVLAEYEIVRVPVHLSDEEQQRYNELSLHVRQFIVERREKDPNFTWETLCSESGTDPASRRALRAFRMKQAIEDRAEEKLRVLEDLFRLHAGSPVIVFAGSNAMAREVSRRFLIPCLLSHCGKVERLEVLTGLQAGTYPALVCNQVLDEGVDLPEVKVAVVIGGMASTKQARQRLGRILRKSGNARAMLYEVVCADTNESKRSRQRRDHEAYAGTRHRKM